MKFLPETEETEINFIDFDFDFFFKLITCHHVVQDLYLHKQFGSLTK